MADGRRHRERRADALSRERIVDAAVALLDREGEAGLTVRRLAGDLRTGAGAIYHHVANKDELLAAATDAVLAPATTGHPAAGHAEGHAAGHAAGAVADLSGQDAVRAVALAVFDAIDAHPWIGAQLARPTQPAMLRVFELIGRRVRALGVPPGSEFASVSALTNYILGVGGQNAANARSAEHGPDRTDFLTAVAGVWANLDPAEYPFTRTVAGQLREHDDREQFLAGVDLILAGIAVLGRGTRDEAS